MPTTKLTSGSPPPTSLRRHVASRRRRSPRSSRLVAGRRRPSPSATPARHANEYDRRWASAGVIFSALFAALFSVFCPLWRFDWDFSNLKAGKIVCQTPFAPSRMLFTLNTVFQIVSDNFLYQKQRLRHLLPRLSKGVTGPGTAAALFVSAGAHRAPSIEGAGTPPEFPRRGGG